jgi:hypothetical protein
MNAETLEEAKTEAYELGRVSQIESMVYEWKEKAGKAFSLGQRNAADLLMETANDMEKTAKQMRADYMKKYNPEYAKR